MTDRSPISVGIARLDAVPRWELEALPLSDADTLRAASFRAVELRTRFLVGRWLARGLAAAATAVAVELVDIGVDPLGRPVLAGAAGGWFVSLTHSGGLVVAAVCDVPVGVDAEQLPDRPLHPLVEARICSPTELGKLTRLAGSLRQQAFMRVWACKEAYGKALGVGLDFPWREVTAGPDGVRIGGVADRYFVTDLDVGPGYAAALVSAGRRRRIDVQNYPKEHP
jgi:4'-phosphopantetheinyl transferase